MASYKVKNKEIQELKNTIANKDLALTVEYPNYKLDGEPLCFYERTEDWQAPYTGLNEFFTYYHSKPDEPKFTYRGGICSFKSTLLNYSPFQEINRYFGIYDYPPRISITKYSSDTVGIYERFNDNNNLKATTSADRLVILVQAAGGGGGGTSSVYKSIAATSVYSCIGGKSGGAGGSGGFLAFVLNTKYLKDNGGTFQITLGQNGRGVERTETDGATEVYTKGEDHFRFVQGLNGTNANNCEVYYYESGTSSAHLFTVGGGKGGTSASEYTAGTPGVGGQVTEYGDSYKNKLYWLLPIYSYYTYREGTLYGEGILYGKTGGKVGENGQSTPILKIKTAPSITDNKLRSNFTCTIGGYSGGYGEPCSDSYPEYRCPYASSGGAASYLGRGGYSGILAGNGEYGDIGAGGGGGQWTRGEPAEESQLSQVAKASIRNGGHGGPAKIMIFY